MTSGILKKIAGDDSSVLDIVFIHGLSGDPTATWECPGDGSFWPLWLCEDIQSIAIYSVGYPASVFAKAFVSEQSIFDFAGNALEVMSANGIGERPIAFVAHSLGGILLKIFLRISDEASDRKWKKISENCNLNVFLSTPHSGALLARILKVIPKISSKHIALIADESGALDELKDSYCKLARRMPALKTFAYYESKKTYGVALVVDKASADPGCCETRAISMKGKDHFSICKPDSRADELYKVLHSRIEEVRNTAWNEDAEVKTSQTSFDAGNGSGDLESDVARLSVRSVLEGHDSAVGWFINWRDELQSPEDPPSHWLLNSIFVESEVYSQILNSFIAGKQRQGLTGFVGMGGVGKTYTALKISWILKQEYSWQVVWVGLLQQGTDEALEQIASRFGLMFALGLNTVEKTAAIGELISRATKVFPNLLIVLDNAENFPRLDLLLEVSRGASVLVTSRRRECSSIIPYKKIEPLSGRRALQFCIEFLAKYGYDIEPDSLDANYLVDLCKNLGGHPLGIRMALANFVQQPVMDLQRKSRFKDLLEKIKLRKIASLNAEVGFGATLDETSLHRTIRDTFLWTYDDLGRNYNNTVSTSAHLLLPVLSALGTASVDRETVVAGLTALEKQLLPKREVSDIDSKYPEKSDLLEQFEAPSESDPEGSTSASKPDHSVADTTIQDPRYTTIFWLLTEDNLFQSVNLLTELSLVEIVNADEWTLAIHPLIREFSFDYSEAKDDKTATVSVLTSSELFSMAIEVLGKDRIGDSFVDLLPRLKSSRLLAELAIKQVRNQLNSLYFDRTSGSWQNLSGLLAATSDLARSAGLEQHETWADLNLGELLDRFGDEKGGKLIENALFRYLKGNANSLKIEDRLDLIFDTEELPYSSASHKVYWPALHSEICFKGIEKGEELQQHIFDILRIMSAKKNKHVQTISKVCEFGQHDRLGTDRYFSWMNRHYRPDDKLLSNQIIYLQEWLKYAVPLLGARAVDKAKGLFEQALDRGRSSEHKDSLTPAVFFDFKQFESGVSFQQGQLARDEYRTRMSELRQDMIAEGFRGFKNEFNCAIELSKWEFGRNCFKDAIKHLTRARSLIPLMDPNARDHSLQPYVGLLLVSAQIMNLANADLGEIDEIIEAEVDKIKTKKFVHLAPYVLFAKTCQMSFTEDRAALGVMAAQTEDAFLYMNGYVPEFLWCHLSGWRSWNSTDKLAWKDDWIESEVRLDRLPERVVSKKDGRKMRLVHGGIQFDKNGREHSLWPFYIDEEPLSFKDLQRFAEEMLLDLGNVGNLNQSVHLGDDLLQEFCAWSGRKVPVSAEAHAAWLQHERGILPVQPVSKPEILEAVFDRIEEVILNGEPRSEKTAASPEVEKNLKRKKVSKPTEAKVPNLDKLFNEAWMISHISEEKYKSVFLAPFTQTSVGKKKQRRLAHLLASSLSLNVSEKQRVLNAARERDDEGKPRLTKKKCNKLITVFEEEREKFLELERDNPQDVARLIQKQIEGIARLSGKLFVRAIDHEEAWTLIVTYSPKTQRYSEFIGAHHEELTTSTFVADNFEGSMPVFRGVIPVDSAKDLIFLEPI